MMNNPCSTTETLNQYATRWGVEEAKKRAINYMCSLALGREFGESFEDYLARKPELQKSYNACKQFIGRAR